MADENDPRWDRCTCGHWRADHDHWAVALSRGTIEHACDSCEVTVSEHEFSQEGDGLLDQQEGR